MPLFRAAYEQLIQWRLSDFQPRPLQNAASRGPFDGHHSHHRPVHITSPPGRSVAQASSEATDSDSRWPGFFFASAAGR
jgi:hypothetical protein